MFLRVVFEGPTNVTLKRVWSIFFLLRAIFIDIKSKFIFVLVKLKCVLFGHVIGDVSYS